MSDVTPYAETETLLAVMNGDIDRAGVLLAEMFDGELCRFTDQANLLVDLCRREGRSRAVRP